jgi:hypothetical protein
VTTGVGVADKVGDGEYVGDWLVGNEQDDKVSRTAITTTMIFFLMIISEK